MENTNTPETINALQQIYQMRIEAKLRDLPVGHTKLIGGCAVTRWAATFEIGTWGKPTRHGLPEAVKIIIGTVLQKVEL